MPTSCVNCPCGNDESRYCKAANEYIPTLVRPEFCPLVEIPTPHGRLIDADGFAELIRYAIKCQKYESLSIGETLTVADVLNSVVTELKGTSINGFENAPTVIEAEED